MLKFFLLFTIGSFSISCAFIFGTVEHGAFCNICTLIFSTLLFVLGLTEGIVWAAHPVAVD